VSTQRITAKSVGAALAGPNPVLVALRTHADREDAVRACPWLGKPSKDGKYRRNIDRPLWRDLHAEFHRTESKGDDHAEATDERQAHP
jgi:hypothetical protein